MKFSQTMRGAYTGIQECAACGTRLSELQISSKGGVCRYCGVASGGNKVRVNVYLGQHIYKRWLWWPFWTFSHTEKMTGNIKK